MVGRFGFIFSSVYISEHQEVTDVIGRGKGKNSTPKEMGAIQQCLWDRGQKRPGRWQVLAQEG